MPRPCCSLPCGAAALLHRTFPCLRFTRRHPTSHCLGVARRNPTVPMHNNALQHTTAAPHNRTPPWRDPAYRHHAHAALCYTQALRGPASPVRGFTPPCRRRTLHRRTMPAQNTTTPRWGHTPRRLAKAFLHFADAIPNLTLPQLNCATPAPCPTLPNPGAAQRHIAGALHN